MSSDEEFGHSKEEVEAQRHGEKGSSGRIDKSSSRDFRYLDGLIHSGVNEITLDSDITFSDGDDLNSINLDVDGLVIDGNGFAVDACRKTRIFNCTADNVTLKNITLKNGFSEYDGAAIYNSRGTMTIENAILDGNSAKGDGGAIYNTQKRVIASQTTKFKVVTISIKDSKLINNTAGGQGGAIYNGGCDIVFDPSNVDRYDMYSAERYNEIELENCELSNNSPDDVRTDKKYTHQS